MKTLKILLMGIIPILCGFLLHYIIIYFHMVPTWLSVVLLFLWGVLAYKLFEPNDNKLIFSCMINGVGIVMLLLALFQELVLGRYWFNLAGTLPQMYFLPCLNAAEYIVLIFTGEMLFPVYHIIEFILMFVVSILGCIVKEKTVRGD